MQIDFHHAVTYVAARCAGFSAAEASTIAYAAQFVDDATEDGLIRFDNGALCSAVASAHRMLDYRNFEELANHRAWLPFHFLPGNGFRRPGDNPDGSFIQKIICRPAISRNSNGSEVRNHVAHEMVEACLADRDKWYALHRLGITLHVYADTWAHQGFAGICHRVNRASGISEDEANPIGLLGRLKRSFHDLFDEVVGEMIADALPLGHGAVLSYPDRPYARWGYTNGLGERICRDNPADFTVAADEMCRVLRRFRASDPTIPQDGLNKPDRQTVAELLERFTDQDAKVRHRRWLEAIAEGRFSFGAERIGYRSHGEGSWPECALGRAEPGRAGELVYRYRADFLESDWRRFVDALLVHRFEMAHGILPRYGICVA